MVGGGPFTRAWLLNRPEEDNPTAPTYREQFDSLVRMILGERDSSNLELDHFLHITASAASGRQSLSHPIIALLPNCAKQAPFFNEQYGVEDPNAISIC
ncbi:uncharacterized protein Pyn_38003 [Prunus yedoensis var. nudiflora]|uniref:Uncharacterized protein n=1 Tax=Prunus yedoensis var. nudiflora TaxID=2094558 RepID=A0A314Z609_PRUYE|nr:uncharacterized protein Pyn_38003 [Prunus yedoensis var. nudiflora]